MPDGRETGRIGERYQLDYYRHPRSTRSWKWPAAAGAALAALAGTGLFFAVWGRQSFHAAPVSSVHAAFGSDCRRCHDSAWQPAVRLVTGNGDRRSVSNASCQSCHTKIADHHGPAEAGTDSAPACAACHTEHRPERDLRDVADSFCLRCHRDLEGGVGRSGAFASRISDFSSGRDPHPEFAILRSESSGAAANHGAGKVAAWSASRGRWQDRGGLKFNHAVHLADQGVLGKNREAKTLDCSDCHEPAEDGALMAPMNYEQHCRECHPLQLGGKFARFGEIPHEAPGTLRGLLRERLANEDAKSPSADEQPTAEQFVDPVDNLPTLLPNPALVPRERSGAIDAELAEIDHALFGLEAQGYCRKCHHLEADGREWRVLSVDPAIAEVDPAATRSMVPPRWFEHARFNHAKHRTAPCTTCHQVKTSKLTTDILLPSIDACRECHGSTAAAPAAHAGDRCAQCHQYHTSARRFHP